MKHFLIHFKNGQFAVARGESMVLLPDEFAVISYENTTAGEPVAQFAREAVVGYREVCGDDAAKYRLLWVDLQFERVAKSEKGAEELIRDHGELEEEVLCLRKETKTLADFLLTDFKEDVGAGSDSWESAVGAAIRLLTELKARREEVQALTTAVVELSDWHIETQEGETNDGISL